MKVTSIPKIIHCCRFGQAPLSQLEVKCLQSWQHFLPDYEIKIWDESNIELVSPVVVQNLNDKVYAFVSDYVRFEVLYRYGGVYLDNDMEVLKSLDEFLSLPCFLGIESENFANTAILGSIAGHTFLQECMHELDLKGHNRNLPYLAPVLATRVLEKSVSLTGMYQEINQVHVFPKSTFYPLSYEEKLQGLEPDVSHSYTLHHYRGSWKNKMRKSTLKKIYHFKLSVQKSFKEWIKGSTSS